MYFFYNLLMDFYQRLKIGCIQIFIWGFAVFQITKITFIDVFSTLLLVVGMLFVMALPITELIDFISRRKKHKLHQQQIQMQLIYKEKNEDLMGFYQKPRLSWSIYHSLACIAIFALAKELLIVLTLAALLFVQILNQMQPSYEQKSRMRLRNTLLKTWPKEKGSSKKSFHYAIIMEDDSGLAPSTFSKNHDPSLAFLIFDHKTEVEPFLEKDPERNFDECWKDLYFFTDFFIYIFDSANYTMQELEEKCKAAAGYMHFPISRPVYIFLLGQEEALEPILLKFTWMNEISFQVIEAWNQLDLQKVIDNYKAGRTVPFLPEQDKAYAEKLGEFGERIYKASEREDASRRLVKPETQPDKAIIANYGNHLAFLTPYIAGSLEKPEDDDKEYFFRYANLQTKQIFMALPAQNDFFYFQAKNTYVCGFFQNIFRWQEIHIAVNVEIEYTSLAMRFVYYYLFSKHEEILSADTVIEDKKLGETIYQKTQEEDPFYQAIHREWPLESAPLRYALHIVKELYAISHKEELLDFPEEELLGFLKKEQLDFLNFLNLVNILRLVRNAVAHGVVREGMQERLWFALYVLLILLNEMLCVSRMEIELEKHVVKISYESDKCWYWNEQYAITEDGFPTLLNEIKENKNYNKHKYINYYKGSIAVPEEVEINIPV